MGFKIRGNNPTRALGDEDVNGLAIELIYDNTTGSYPTRHGTCVTILQNNADLGGALYWSSDAELFFKKKWVTWDGTWQKVASTIFTPST